MAIRFSAGKVHRDAASDIIDIDSSVIDQTHQYSNHVTVHLTH